LRWYYRRQGWLTDGWIRLCYIRLLSIRVCFILIKLCCIVEIENNMFLPVCQLRILLRQGRNLQHRRRLHVLCEFEISFVSEISELVKASWVREATVLSNRRRTCLTQFVPMILVFLFR
jgi:hypothetical protein